MVQMQIPILFVCLASALSLSAPDPSDPFIPIYNAISSLPGTIFSHHTKPHSSYSPEPIFHHSQHNPVTIHKHNPVDIHKHNPVNIHKHNPVNIHKHNPVSIHKHNPVSIHKHNPLSIHKPQPIPVIIDDSTPVYKPKHAPVYLDPTFESKQHHILEKVHHEIEPSYNDVFVHEVKGNEVLHEYKPEGKVVHETKHIFKPYQEKPKPYSFDYGVKDAYSGANFGHAEKSDGNEVKGSYMVALPDGRIQKVTYTADDYNGFQAEVTYEGEAHYPHHIPLSKPEIHLPREYSVPDLKPHTEYTPPQFEFKSAQHNHIAPHDIHVSLPHHIPTYNPLPTPPVYTIPHH